MSSRELDKIAKLVYIAYELGWIDDREDLKEIQHAQPKSKAWFLTDTFHKKMPTVPKVMGSEVEEVEDMLRKLGIYEPEQKTPRPKRNFVQAEPDQKRYFRKNVPTKDKMKIRCVLCNHLHNIERFGINDYEDGKMNIYYLCPREKPRFDKEGNLIYLGYELDMPDEDNVDS